MKASQQDDTVPPSFLVPVTTMEEIVTLTVDERRLLLASLEAADAEFAEGKGAPYDPAEMRAHFMQGLEEQRRLNAKAKQA